MTDPPHDWRAYLPALDGYPLLPCGAGPDGKAPLDPSTGGHAHNWQTATWTPSQIAALNGSVLCCGTRTGPDANGLLVFDIDGASAIDYCCAHGCDPAIRTWHIVRNTDPNRYKIAFKVPHDLWGHISGKRKHKTAPNEQIEMFFGTGQIIVLGTHRPSGGYYYWPEHHTPADIIEPPPEWWALALLLGNDAPSNGITIDDRPPLPFTGNDDLTRAADALRYLDPSCPYDDWIKVGMALHAIDPSGGFAIWDRWSASSSKYPGTKALEHHWRSFKTAGNGKPPAGAGSIFKAAKAAGWHDPSRQRQQAPHSGTQAPSGLSDPGDPDERPQRRRSELLTAALDAAESGDHDTQAEIQAELMGRFRMTGSQVQAALFRLLTQRRSSTSTAKPGFVNVATVQHLDHLVPGFLAANEQTLLHAPKGTGKTLAALAIARAVVTGTPLLDQGTPAIHGRVLYLATDSGCASMHTQMQELGLLNHPAFTHGHPEQRFFLRGHDAEQGVSAWEATIDEILWLLQTIDRHQLDLVIIDSAKACLSLTDTDYTDNRAVGALLTLFQRVVAPRCSILWLHHDGRETGQNAGAKAWAEIPVIVHRIERVQEQPTRPRHRGAPGPDDTDAERPPVGARKWVCVKSRIPGDERDFHYLLTPSGDLQVAADVEVIGNCRDAVLQVLLLAHQCGEDSLSWTDLASRVMSRHGRSTKTVKNTISKMARGRTPDLIRPTQGTYAINEKLLEELISYRGVDPSFGTIGRDPSDSNGSDRSQRGPNAVPLGPDGISDGATGSPIPSVVGTALGPRWDRAEPASTLGGPGKVPTSPHTPPMADSSNSVSTVLNETAAGLDPLPVGSDDPAGNDSGSADAQPQPAAFAAGDRVIVFMGDQDAPGTVLTAPSDPLGRYRIQLDDGQIVEKGDAWMSREAGNA